MKKTAVMKTILFFIGFFIMLIPIKTNAEPFRGSRENPLYAYESYITDVYDYDTYIGKFEIQLLDYKHGQDAYDYVMKNEYNTEPTSSQEYIYIKFKINYLSGSRQVDASDVINHHSNLFNSDANYQLDNIDWGYGFEDVDDMANVSLYPGGSTICSKAIIVRTGNSPITYRIQTGYNNQKYERVFTWFTTYIPEGRCPRGCTYSESISKNPTCTTEGERKYSCIRCWYYYTENIPATGHKYSNWNTTKKSTIFNSGIKTRTCSNCGKEEYQTIKKLKSSVSIKKKVSVKKGKTVQLKIIKKFKGDKVSSWKSSKKSVATVNKKGKVTAKKKGKAKITVKMKSGCKATCTVTVK